MRCSACNSEVDKRWRFCPVCGTRLFRAEGKFFTLGDLFARMNKEIEKMNKLFEESFGKFDKDFEVFDLTPFFSRHKAPGTRGFSIRIERKSGETPKIDVKTFGNIDKKEIEKALKEKLGVTSAKGFAGSARPEKKIRIIPEKTEEPTTKVTRIGEKLIVEMELPGVKSLEDIDIKRMLESIEVKGYAKDKLYFKILQIPRGARIIDKSFENEILRLEIV